MARFVETWGGDFINLDDMEGFEAQDQDGAGERYRGYVAFDRDARKLGTVYSFQVQELAKNIIPNTVDASLICFWYDDEGDAVYHCRRPIIGWEIGEDREPVTLEPCPSNGYHVIEFKAPGASPCW